MTRMEFDQRMAAGLADAEAERGVEIEEAFESISAILKEGTDLNENSSTLYISKYLQRERGDEVAMGFTGEEIMVQ